ncbi:RnfABCDGE type electron transport complex subunit D [[Clostridium] polysaccharolyticum]|uniref:Ion-translocating oxidoreductase complex subunit D n=1 Tax=[Clostridium] polysaccharolyticum TaxID=29364 RepID=A0A1I0BT89_9FIRM|nr:RnfABCDGE type electron transport complex subunit D [[Clostridium] polysaccharolyticum]SET10279.1 electron transport complex protein RnfD [[Clostridium] polysaccharolyticum]
MSELLNVSASPHVRSKDSTKTIMRDVAIALVPAAGFGVYNFGMKALLVLVLSIVSCMLTEYIYEKLMHKKITVCDYSALVTGLLLGMNLPASVPFWMPVLGGVFAILIVKMLFGGLGQNFMNPALAARCFLMISFAKRMTTFTYDGVTGATPLYLIKSGEKASSVSDILSQNGTSVFDMFTGTIAGTIGETSVIALLIGAAYLLIKKVITWKIPVIYIATFAVFAMIFGGRGFDINYLAAEICGGGLVLGAFFMATDYVTSPITPMGQIVFAVLLGLLTGIFRIFGGTAEGVSYAIIFCNLLVPLIERVTMPVPFGKEGVKNEK